MPLITRVRAACAGLTSLYLALALPGTARANGRFPEAEAIVTPVGATDPAALQTLYLRATFGVVVSRDAGKTWRWICEQALGFEGTWDPPLAATRDGKLFIGLADGLRFTTDGCATEEASALHGETVADLTLDPTGGEVVALLTTANKPGRVVWLDTRGKVTSTLGAIEGLKLDTVEVAPSAPKVVYVTGVPSGPGPRPHLYRGERGGKLVEVKPANVASDQRLLVSAIDPKNPDRILLRALSGAGSQVLLSTDGGKTVRTVLEIKSSMFGFAKSDDGSTYWAGSGDPTDGIYRSRDRGETWEPMAKLRVYCLHAHGQDLYACSTPYRPDGFAVAVSHDGGKSFDRLNRFSDIEGPLACDAGAGAVCGLKWPEMQTSLAPPPASTTIFFPDAAPAEASDAGAAPPDAGSVAAKSPRSACGCQAVGAEKSNAFGLFLLLVLPLARRRVVDRDGPNPSRAHPRTRRDSAPD